MAEKPKSFVAHIQWNAEKNYFAGFIPGIDGTESTAYSREELMAILQRKLGEQLKAKAASPQPEGGLRPGFHKVDIIL
jgi:predicted RNase H-like HicB family nuclease